MLRFESESRVQLQGEREATDKEVCLTVQLLPAPPSDAAAPIRDGAAAATCTRHLRWVVSFNGGSWSQVSMVRELNHTFDYPSTAQVWQTLKIGKSPRFPNNLIISGAVHGQISEQWLGVVC